MRNIVTFRQIYKKNKTPIVVKMKTAFLLSIEFKIKLSKFP